MVEIFTTGEICTGGIPDIHGALESYFPVVFYRGVHPHSGFVCSHSGCVCPHSGDVYCFIGGTPEKHGDLTVVFQYFFTGELIHTVVSCIQTEVVCVVKGGGGDSGKHEALKSVFPVFLREIETHNGSVYTDSGCCL